jgi:hypothetical protein
MLKNENIGLYFNEFIVILDTESTITFKIQ